MCKRIAPIVQSAPKVFGATGSPKLSGRVPPILFGTRLLAATVESVSDGRVGMPHRGGGGAGGAQHRCTGDQA